LPHASTHFTNLYRKHKVFAVCYSLHYPLLGVGFQRRTLSFLYVPELSPASATIFSQQQLTRTEPQQFSHSPTHSFSPSSSSVNYGWSSPAQSFLASSSVGNHDHIFVLSRLLRILKWGFLFVERRGLTITGHSSSFGE
jgi:hypothetical protein